MISSGPSRTRERLPSVRNSRVSRSEFQNLGKWGWAEIDFNRDPQRIVICRLAIDCWSKLSRVEEHVGSRLFLPSHAYYQRGAAAGFTAKAASSIRLPSAQKRGH